MKNIFKILTLTFIILAGSLCGQENEYTDIISNFISHVKKNDSESIAKLMNFPFIRAHPLPTIKNEKDFQERYFEIFDEDLRKMIIESDIDVDWREVGWRGIMLYNGVLWMDTNGQLLTINYHSEYEKKEIERLINLEKTKLHESLDDLLNPIFLWETKKFRIRVDRIGENKYRYASWDVSKGQNEKPDLILKNGKRIPDGNGGNHHYSFISGIYEYQCQVVVLGNFESPPGYLRVLKNGKRILSERVIKNVSN